MRGCLGERNPNRVLNSKKDQMNGYETPQQENTIFSSHEYAKKLQKAFTFSLLSLLNCGIVYIFLIRLLFPQDNLRLTRALAQKSKLLKLSGIENQKLRVNLRDVQEKNLQFAKANRQMLAEHKADRDRLKTLEHELGCKNVLPKARKLQLEEQTLPCTDHSSKDKVLLASKDKIPANASDEDCKPSQPHDTNQIDTKRKQTRERKRSSKVKPIHVNEKANSKRRVCGVIDAIIIPEETSQTEDDIGANQIGDKKFVRGAANSVEDSKRVSSRRDFEFQEPEPSENRQPTAKHSLTLSRVSSRRDFTVYDFPEGESVGSMSEAVETPSQSSHDTTGKQRVSTRRQSTKDNEAIREIARVPSLCNGHSSKSVITDHDKKESKKKPSAARKPIPKG